MVRPRAAAFSDWTVASSRVWSDETSASRAGAARSSCSDAPSSDMADNVSPASATGGDGSAVWRRIGAGSQGRSSARRGEQGAAERHGGVGRHRRGRAGRGRVPHRRLVATGIDGSGRSRGVRTLAGPPRPTPLPGIGAGSRPSCGRRRGGRARRWVPCSSPRWPWAGSSTRSTPTVGSPAGTSRRPSGARRMRRSAPRGRSVPSPTSAPPPCWSWC